MKVLRSLAVLLLVLVAFGSSASAQKTEEKRIDRYVESIEAIATAAKKPHLIYADTSAYEDRLSKPSWVKFVSTEALEKYREEKQETYSVAYIWKKDGKMVLVRFTLFSPSGDWAQYDTHYFRADGSIAKSESELRTFYGDFVLKRTKWYNVAGRQIASTRAYFDIQTNKPISKPKEGYESEVVWYKKLRELPFLRK